MPMRRRDLLAAAALGLAGSLTLSRAARGADVPKRGGVLRIRGEEPLGFDPHLTLSFRTMTNLSFTHSRLLKVKAGPAVRPGTTPFEGDLAESWTRPTETTYVFRLRRGVRWHPRPPVNGRELTADDVKFTYDRFLTVTGNPNRAALRQVTRIDAVDRYTVRFALAEPFAWFLEKLAGTAMWIVPREAVERFGDLKRAESCIGTGPWMLERYEPRVRLTFVRNPDYFVPGLPYADAVEVGLDEELASRLASWLAGRYDFAPEYGMALRRLDLELARSREPGLQTAEFVPLVGGLTHFRLDRTPLSDVRVRRALLAASDWREAVAADAFAHGHGVPNPAVPAALSEWSLPRDALGPDVLPLYRHDPQEARRLLSEAGYPGGFQIVVETTGGYGADFLDSVQLGVKNWNAVGVAIELRVKEYGAFLAAVTSRKFEAIAMGLRGAAIDPDAYLAASLPGDPSNTGGVDDAKLTEMIKLQRRTFDVGRRRDIVHDIQRHIARHVYYLHGPSVIAIAGWKSYVRNFSPNVGHDYGGRLMAVWLDT
jgi:peptide/nickel transport system substrate-binding protein